MSYQVLARKWRPRNFAEMVGQEHVLRALINALDQGRLHQAYLFTGTRGVGKTTIARIVAKALNCETGVSSTPCGECSACQEIDQGRFLDLIEVDAASRTKVEDTRELLDNVQYSPTRGRYKIYLIDEVHMLSNHSFNALLKTLEEPPAHIIFLFATTDPQKLPATILSRCLQFHLQRMPPDLIQQQLGKILDAESIEYDTPSLTQLAHAADGSMRDALSLLDQAIAYGHGALQAADVANMLGTVAKTPIYTMLDALLAEDGAALLQATASLHELGADHGMVLDDLLSMLQQIAIAQWVPDSVNRSSEEPEKIQHYAAQIKAEDVQLYYQIGLLGKRDLPLSPNPQHGLEMILLRMLAFRPQSGSPQNAGSSSATSARSNPGNTGKTASAAVTQAPTHVATSDAQPVTSAPPAESMAELSWKDLVQTLDLKGMLAELANHCDAKHWQSPNLTLVLEQEHAQLHNDTFVQRLQDRLSEHFGTSIRLQIELGQPMTETPAQATAREAQTEFAAAVNSIEQDPLVQNLKQRFDAEVILETVQPRT